MDIHILMVDFEETLVTSGRLFPHVREALDAFRRFTTNLGDPLPMGLIVDTRMPEVPRDQNDVDAILDQLGIGEFFERPTEQVICVTAEVARKLPRSLFEMALRRMKGPGELENIAFLTGKTAQSRTYMDYGMHVLSFTPSRASEGNFHDWAEAPLQVARCLFPKNAVNFEIALSAYLQIRHDMEVVFLEDVCQKKTITGVAKSWFPLEDERLGPLSGVYVQMPARIQVNLDDKGEIHATSTPPGPDEMQEAAHLVLSLHTRGHIQGKMNELGPGHTHIIETDSVGRRRLIRKRFS